MSAFGDLLKTALDQAGMSQMDLARALTTSSSVISQTCSGQRLPPLDRIAVWADALRLSASRREDFIAAAHLAHAPERVQQQVGRLQETVDAAGEASPAALRLGESAVDEVAIAHQVAAAIADCYAQFDPDRHAGIPPVDLAWIGRNVLDELLQRLEREWIRLSATRPMLAVQTMLMAATVEFHRTLRPSDPATVEPALRRLGAALEQARLQLVSGKRPRHRR